MFSSKNPEFNNRRSVAIKRTIELLLYACRDRWDYVVKYTLKFKLYLSKYSISMNVILNINKCAINKAILSLI